MIKKKREWRTMKYKKFMLILITAIFLVSIASASASDANDTLVASEDTNQIELSDSDKAIEDNLQTSEEQKVTQAGNEEKTGATDDGTFKALSRKIGSASSGDTVYLENNYSCEDSWIYNGITIDKSNLVIDGQGHTIDAKRKTGIFYVYQVENVTIKNIKFINTKYISNGGAIYLSGNNCTISDCVFINNAAISEAGAIYLSGNNCTISDCVFINNTVDWYGGAINWEGNDVTISDCVFINNTSYMGGAIYVDWATSSCGDISCCVFINNTAEDGGAIDWDVKGGSISDCAFINNNKDICFNMGGSASLNRNWFGNTAENYKSSPHDDANNWLFLNATVNPNSIIIAETADVIFKLYLYDRNSGNITEYTTLAEVDLTLNSNGKLDKNVTGLYEKATFTPTSTGTGSITATIGNVTYTTTITVNKVKTKLFADPITAAYNSNKKLIISLKDVNGKPLSGVKVTVKIKSDKTYTTDANGQVKISVGKLTPKTYNVKITFKENADFKASQTTVKVTVKKAKSKITAKKKTIKKAKKYTVTLKSGKKPIQKAKILLKIKKKTFKAKTNKKGKATFKINKFKKGKYTAKITFKGNKYYKKASQKVKITIK